MQNIPLFLEGHKNTFDFEKVKKEFNDTKSWGLSASLDCRECDPQMIRSKELIEKYIYELCDLIEMKRFGDPVIVFFGEDPCVEGYSMTQLIETSLVSGHFANQTNTAYIDIFSCKLYNPVIAAEFTQRYFKSRECKLGFSFRG